MNHPPERLPGVVSAVLGKHIQFAIDFEGGDLA
jgi:hypothetical protein